MMKKLKILHVIPSIHPRYGGPSKAVVDMCRSQIKEGIKADILTTHFKGEKPTLYNDLNIYSLLCMKSEYKFSFKLKKWLNRNIKKYDLVHIHSVFNYSSLIASKLAIKNKIPIGLIRY